MTETPSSAVDRAIDALTAVLETAIAPDMLEAQQIILRRLALSGDLFPSRVPPPLNITEVGGYLNLIANDPVMYAQVLASVLGVAGPNPSPGFTPTLPQLYYATVPNDRPTGPSQPVTPVQATVRSDFAPPLQAALDVVHARGAQLPILWAQRPLPPVALGIAPPTDLLPYLGRELRLVPGAALIDPTTDPLAVGSTGGGAQRVVARQTDATATEAASVAAAAWDLWTCDNSACTASSVNAAFVEVEPLLAAAGWHRLGTLAAPTSAQADAGWHTFANLTGLQAGVTTAGDELRLLHSAGALAASSIRERLDWVWNGTAFVAPAV